MMNALFALILLVFSACAPMRPIQINSDPNQERLERTHEDVEKDNVEAFIAEHPEMSAEMKRQLREGTMSRSAAEERLKAKTSPK